MRVRGLLTLCFALVAAAPVAAQSYDFDVQYFGTGVATLAGGSDDPNDVTVYPGDDFTWTITAQNGGFWNAPADVSQFPFMAFGTLVAGDWLGDYELWLYNDGIQQLHIVSSNVLTQFAHLGTNSVFLNAGTSWDQMVLFYEMLDSSAPGMIGDPSAPELGAEPTGYLPILGAPEMNVLTLGAITYQVGTPNDVVPEPATMTLLATGLASLAAARRRRRLA